MPSAPFRNVILAATLAAAAALVPQPARAQQPARLWEPRGFDFKPDGVWRRRARQVAAARAAAMRQGDFRSLNSAIRLARAAPALVLGGAAQQSPMAITGVLNVPVFLVRFKNTDTTTLHTPAEYDSVLLDSVAPQGRAYTVRTFYDEMSRGLFKVRGVVIGWIALDSNDSWYAGGGTCDGICGNSRVAQLIQEAVDKTVKADPTINWAQFDSDGDGEVDLVWLIHPKPGAECGNSGNIWAHRYYYSAWTGAPLPTPTAFGSGRIVIDNYTIQSGVGGIAQNGTMLAGCDPANIMPPGTVAHETGHGLGLPDFYDTNPTDQDNSEGIGEWGLMGSGNWARQGSPAHMEAFSLAQLGWVHVQQLDTTGTYRFGPVETGDTVFALRPTVANPRGEYFLLESRQGLLADSAMITKHHGGGLLVWHVDSTQYSRCTLPSNCVNTGPIHGLSLVQADGLDNLGSSTPGVSNRGDAGDPYPGLTHNTELGLRSAPSAVLNTGGAAGIALDSITQVVPNGEMSFRLRSRSVVTVLAGDTAARIRVGDTLYRRYENLFLSGDTLTISADTVQTSADARRKFFFASWSDSGAQTHVVTLGAASVTFTANFRRQFLVSYSANALGGIGASPNASTSGSYLAEGASVTLTATPLPGKVFATWTGDTTTLNPVLRLNVTRPWSVVATFMDPLTADAIVNQFLNRAGSLSADQVRYLDLLGNSNGKLDIGDIAAWLDKAGTPAAAEAMRRVMAGSPR